MLPAALSDLRGDSKVDRLIFNVRREPIDVAVFDLILLFDGIKCSCDVSILACSPHRYMK